jgi:quinohemoprotein ethanol dehydrogenase
MEAGWAYSNRDDEVPWFLGGLRESPQQLKALSKGKAPARYGGYLRAWDPVKQRLAWEVDLGGMWNGGVLATAGNLVFQGTGSGWFNAYDARTGRVLKRIEVGTGIMAAPIAYQVKGEQYIAVLAGWGGGQMPAIEQDSAIARFANDGRILAFRLGGGTVPLPAPARPRTIPEPPNLDVKGTAAGRTLYSMYCGYCHADHGMVGILPNVRALTAAKHQMFDDIVLRGALRPNGMSSFADVLTEEQVHDIHAYLLSEQRKLWQEQQRREAAHEPASTPALIQ